MATPAEIIYRIDAEDRITTVNAAWDRFAEDNGAPLLAHGAVLGRPLWDFITDRTTRYLYAELLKRVRQGRGMILPFRCDSPDRRRFLEMAARPGEEGTVEFRVRASAVEERESQSLLDAGARRRGAPLRMCGWCKKVPDGTKWVEVEEVVAKYKLFDAAALPPVSHGICEDCEKRVLSSLKGGLQDARE